MNNFNNYTITLLTIAFTAMFFGSLRTCTVISNNHSDFYEGLTVSSESKLTHCMAAVEKLSEAANLQKKELESFQTVVPTNQALGGHAP